MSSAEQEALRILAEVCNVKLETLKPETHLVRDLDLDSAMTLDLLMTMEETLEAEISDLDAASFVTVGDVLTFVAKLKPA